MIHMQAKSLRASRIIVLICGLHYLVGCQTDWYSRSSIILLKDPQVESEKLLTGVAQMWRSYGTDMDLGKVKRSEEIPMCYWNAPIRDLHPIAVYRDVSNYVIVQKIVGGTEYGKYIMFNTSQLQHTTKQF